MAKKLTQEETQQVFIDFLIESGTYYNFIDFIKEKGYSPEEFGINDEQE